MRWYFELVYKAISLGVLIFGALLVLVIIYAFLFAPAPNP
jgi:hypothetical protein